VGAQPILREVIDLRLPAISGGEQGCQHGVFKIDGHGF
jgi:hypothetical protein